MCRREGHARDLDCGGGFPDLCLHPNHAVVYADYVQVWHIGPPSVQLPVHRLLHPHAGAWALHMSPLCSVTVH